MCVRTCLHVTVHVRARAHVCAHACLCACNLQVCVLRMRALRARVRACFFAMRARVRFSCARMSACIQIMCTCVRVRSYLGFYVRSDIVFAI